MTGPTAVNAPNVTFDPRAAPPTVRAFVEATAAKVDAALDAWLPSQVDDPGRLIEAMRYAVLGPGKRLRPALVAATCLDLGGTEAAWLPAACAIEALHAYTLVHDDLPAMDDDDVRRGRPTVHIAFGEATAILAGDGLLTWAFELLGTHLPGAAVACLARRAGAHALLRGQAIDLAMDRAGPATLDTLAHLHARKTGDLFAAAAELGAHAAGAQAHAIAEVGAFGMAFGVGFQFADDRDDAEFAMLADLARARMASLAAEATAHAARLQAPRLGQFAAWLGQLA